ncbi:13768_t:CDS:1, partial [Gigaspora rosea]
GKTNQFLYDKQLNESIWDLPDYRLSKDGSNKFSFEKQVDNSIWDLPDNRPL